MAEVVLSTAAARILRKLREFDHASLQLCLSRELEKFKNVVGDIYAVALDAEDQFENPQVKDRVHNVAQLLNDGDDLLDDLSSERGKAYASAGCCSVVCFLNPKMLFTQLRVTIGIRAITEKINDLEKFGYRFVPSLRLDDHKKKNLIVTETYSGIPDVVVGRESDVVTLRGMMLNKKDETRENFSVICIDGMGGIGKTTLAQLLFNDSIIRQHFDCRIWVHVGDDSFDVRRIVTTMLEALTHHKIETLDLDILNARVRESLMGRRYLLVLDDVRRVDREKWDILQSMLKVAGTGSKVLVTTRHDMVAGSDKYTLQPFSKQASKSLFHETVFHGNEMLEDQVGDLVDKILEKCRGNPLLVRTVGGVLRFKRTRPEWLDLIEQRIIWIDDQPLIRVLKHSYHQLPSHLKQCFQYCSLFPRDSAIEVLTMIHLWNAQGFIQQRDGEMATGLEDKGYHYLNQLLDRAMLEGEKDESGLVKTVKIHNLLHELAKSLAWEKSNTVGVNEHSEESISDQVVHLSFSCHLDSSDQLPASVIRAKSLRTIYLANQEWRSSSSRRGLRRFLLEQVFSSFKRLRALDAHNLGIEQVPSSIRNLKSLRYLDVSDNDGIKSLPDSITELWHLEVLKLDGCERLTQLPRNIWRLSNLRHLYCDQCWSLTHMPRRIGELVFLRTLTCFVLPKEWSAASKSTAAGLSELLKLYHLRGRVKIRNLGEYMKNNWSGSSLESASFLKEKKGLQSLSLCWDPNLDDGACIEPSTEGDQREPEWYSLKCLEPPPELNEFELSGFVGLKFPRWLCTLKDLIRLDIRDCQSCLSLPPLDEFPHLEFCSVDSLPKLEFIDSNRFDGKGSRIPSLLFPSLKELSLLNCPNLRGWWKGGADGVLPKFQSLSILEVRGCPELSQMPLFPKLDKKLFLESASLSPLRQTLQIQEELPPTTPSTSSLTGPLSELKTLWISSIEEPQIMSEDWLCKLESLQHLQIDRWSSLAVLPPGMRRLMHLRDLVIRRCPLLKQRCGGNKAVDWPNISHVPNITIDKWRVQQGGKYKLSDKQSAALIANFSFVHLLSKISSATIEGLSESDLPAELLQSLATLRNLKLANCPKLKSWPHELVYLTSLKRLQITGCPQLEERCAVGCPQLEERCADDNGDLDWAAISHIPNVQIGDRVIRSQPYPEPCNIDDAGITSSEPFPG